MIRVQKLVWQQFDGVLKRIAAGEAVAVDAWPNAGPRPDEFDLEPRAGQLGWPQTPGWLDLALLQGNLKGLKVEYFHTIDSTNTYAAALPPEHGRVCIAEHQQVGRGRRQRQWLSPYARSLSITLEYHLHRPLAQLGGLSSVVGLAVVQVLRDLGAQGVGLKWPNDVLFERSKLCGILVELLGSEQGSRVLIGTGVNVDLTAAEIQSIEQPVQSVRACGVAAARTEIALAIIERKFEMLHRFEREGMASFIDAFNSEHIYHHDHCTILTGDESKTGYVLGIEADGGLRLDLAGSEQVFHGGEVSLRPLS